MRRSPGFRALVNGAKEHDFDCVVIYDVTRGSRNVVDWFTFREQMRALGIKVFSATENLGDISNPADFLHELIMVGFGQHTVLQTRQKSIDGKRQAAKEGVFLGGFPPLGYDIVNRKYVINEREAQVVRRIFDLYANGYSYDYILNDIKHFSITGKRGRPIGKNSLYSVLNNKRYIGIYAWNEHNNRYMHRWVGGKATPEVATVIEGGIPAIIDLNTWSKVEKRMRDNRHNAKNTAKNEYLLSGMITCAKCGAKYIGTTVTSKKGYRTRYYKCGEKHRTKCCDAPSLNADLAEDLVVKHLKQYLASFDRESFIAEIRETAKKSKTFDKKARDELLQVENEIFNLKQAIKNSSLPDLTVDLTKDLENLYLRKKELEKSLGNLDPVTDAMIQDLDEKIKRDVELMDAPSELKRLLHDYVKSIYAYEDTISIDIGVTTIGSRSETFVEQKQRSTFAT